MKYKQHFSEKEFQALEERAARVRHPVDNNRSEDSTPLVYIWLEQEVYAMPMSNLITVHQNILIIPMPCVPAFVAGVANIRGRVMPVIDLAHLLGVEASSRQNDKHILVVASDNTHELVFRVQRIGNGTSETSIKPLPHTLDIPYPQFFVGLLPDGTPQLNVPAILNSPVIVVNDSFESTIR